MARLRYALLAAGLNLMGLGVPARAACTFELKAEIPVTMRGTRPITPVKVNGAAVDFLVDSGAFFSVITPSEAARLKLKPAYARGEIIGIGGSRQLQVADADSFRVGGRNLRDVQFVVAAGVGNGVSGVIGQNLLIAGDVDYDLAGGRVRIMAPKDCGDTPLAYWAVGKPFNAIAATAVSLGAPRTSAMVYVNGKRVSAVFDTGASVSMLKLEAAQRLGLTTEMPGARVAGYTSGIGPHLIRTWVVPINDFRIGDEDVKNTHLRIGDAEQGDFDMLLGADFFLSHHILISNSQHKLYFTYNGGPVFDLTTDAAGPPPPAPPGPSRLPASN